MEQLTPDDRIAAQEKALDAVNCELALLRQHMDARFAGIDVQLLGMRESSNSQFASMQESTSSKFASMQESTSLQFASMQESTSLQFASMQESTSLQFASMQESINSQFASMRQYVDDGLAKLRLEMQMYTRDEVAKAVAPLQAQIDALRNHVDRISRWGFGMMAMILAGEVALLARGLLG